MDLLYTIDGIKGVTLDSNVHNDTIEDAYGPSSDKDENPCCVVVEIIRLLCCMYNNENTVIISSY